MSDVNIFRGYKQEEDRFTNGLIATLQLSTIEGTELVDSFLSHVVGIPNQRITSYRVLQGIDGTADAELSGEDCCIQFETKIVSATLRPEQIDQHLAKLAKRKETLRKLILLTPDDSASNYTKRHVGVDPQLIQHLGWKDVYAHFRKWLEGRDPCVLTHLVQQYLTTIQQRVFDQDIAGIILKTDFGKKSGIFADEYLQDMRSNKWTYWNTPAEYKSLDGTGRKLMFYDRTRQGITAEVQIKKVVRRGDDTVYPWYNEFEPGTLRIFDKPISVEFLRNIPGFENFGVYRKDRSAYRNLTVTQYCQLLLQNA